MTKTNNKVNLPWVEKYRPSTLDDLVSHEDIIKTISKFIKEDQVPHLLFYGPPGTGKTSTILACAKQLYTPAQFSSMVLELNASDDRGIGIVRGHILTFASTRTIFKSGFKLIILDEADAMTLDAQNALRRNFERPECRRCVMSDSDEDEAVEKQLRIVFLGDKYVGKSSIIRRFCCNEYLRSYTATVGAEFYLKRMTLPARREAVLRITDVSSDEQNGAMLDKYLFNANAILLVYDITNKHSFEGLHSWVKEVHRQIRCPPIVAIIGNKSDLEHQRTVSRQSVSGLAREMNVLSYTMSAKTGEAVSLFFLDLVTKYLGIPLTRADKEHQMQVIKAELVKEEEPKKSTVIEKYTENIRFCIICNYLSKITPAIQSRCTRFRFGPLSPEQIVPRLNYVIDEEKVKVSEDGKKALLTLANGDMRKVLNVLQSTWLAYKDVTEDNVYSCVGHPLKSDIENIVKWLLNDDFKTAYTNIKELKTVKGLALNDILEEVHKYVHRIEFPYDILINLLDKMAEIQQRLTSGTNENIQLTTLISAFQCARDITVPAN